MVDRVESVSLNRQQSAGGATTGSVLNARDVKAWQDAFEFLNEAEKQIAEQKKEAEEAASRLYESERSRGYEDGKAEATRPHYRDDLESGSLPSIDRAASCQARHERRPPCPRRISTRATSSPPLPHTPSLICVARSV